MKRTHVNCLPAADIACSSMIGMNLPLFGQESHLRADDIIAFCLYVKFRKQRSPKSSDKISQVLVTPESSDHPKNNDPPKVAIFLKPRFPFCNIKRYAKLIQGLLFMIVMIFDIPIQRTIHDSSANDVQFILFSKNILFSSDYSLHT